MEQYDFAWMAHALRVGNILFYEDDIERPGLWLNMNDTFGYATADAEEIQPMDVPVVYALWKTYGWESVAWWVGQRRQQEPTVEIRRAIASQFNERGLSHG